MAADELRETYSGVPAGVVIDTAIDDADECDEVAEALAVHSIISEERHEEILGEIETCRNQLEQLKSTETAESPVLARILEMLAELKGEQASLKSSMDSMQSRPTPKESAPAVPAEPSPAESTVEPSVESAAVPPAPKPRRFQKL